MRKKELPSDARALCTDPENKTREGEKERTPAREVMYEEALWVKSVNLTSMMRSKARNLCGHCPARRVPGKWGLLGESSVGHRVPEGY